MFHWIMLTNDLLFLRRERYTVLRSGIFNIIALLLRECS